MATAGLQKLRPSKYSLHACSRNGGASMDVAAQMPTESAECTISTQALAFTQIEAPARKPASLVFYCNSIRAQVYLSYPTYPMHGAFGSSNAQRSRSAPQHDYILCTAKYMKRRLLSSSTMAKDNMTLFESIISRIRGHDDRREKPSRRRKSSGDGCGDGCPSGGGYSEGCSGDGGNSGGGGCSSGGGGGGDGGGGGGGD